MPHFARPSRRHASRDPVSFPDAQRRGGIGDRLLFLLLLASWGGGCLGWSLVASALRRLLPPGRGERMGQGAIRIGFRMLLRLMQDSGLCRFDLSALDALEHEPPLVIAANHPTLLDAVLVTAMLRHTVCISKAALWHNPFLGGGLRLAGYLRNDSALSLIRAGIAALRQGRHLLVFPEGTRSPPGGSVHRFHGGFATMAKAAGVPVQTILIEPATPYLTKGWSLFRMPPLPITISVRLGRRFMVGTDAKEFVARLERYFQAELEAGPGSACAGRPALVSGLRQAARQATRTHQPA